MDKELKWHKALQEVKKLSALELVSFLGALHEYIANLKDEDIINFFKK